MKQNTLNNISAIHQNQFIRINMLPMLQYSTDQSLEEGRSLHHLPPIAINHLFADLLHQEVVSLCPTQQHQITLLQLPRRHSTNIAGYIIQTEIHKNERVFVEFWLAKGVEGLNSPDFVFNNNAHANRAIFDRFCSLKWLVAAFSFFDMIPDKVFQTYMHILCVLLTPPPLHSFMVIVHPIFIDFFLLLPLLLIALYCRHPGSVNIVYTMHSNRAKKENAEINSFFPQKNKVFVCV